MKTVKNILFISLLLSGLTSCNDWLNLYPDNAQTTDQYWETKQDVESVVSAGYVKLRNSVNYLFVWGEIRGTGIEVGSVAAGDNIGSAYNLQQLDILTDNAYSKWSNIYQIINMANSVLRYAPSVVEKDPSFTNEEKQSYFSEAYFLRSLAYFYLVRTFKDVPFITEPYVKDEGNYSVPKMDGNEILDFLIDDLKSALPAAKSFFPETDINNPVNTKGRATKWSIYSLLADIYLWKGEYEQCINVCDSVIQSGRVGLIEKELWFSNYLPGNSNESIFEIQYDYKKKQTNDFFTWFYTNRNYWVSQYTVSLFQSTTPLGDIRGDGGTYSGSLTTNYLWKYVGVILDDGTHAIRNSGTQNDQNYIIYRLADIYLMKAEALIMQGSDHYQEALDIIATVRARAGIAEPPLSPLSSELDMLIFLTEERGREFCGEGKSWFDLLRVCSRHDYQYKEYMIASVLQMVSPSRYGIVRSKLSNPGGSYYMPIHKDELTVNKALVQNDYYQNLGNK
jgi:hypothetical protein